MSFTTYSFVITRAGSAVTGSPFSGRRQYVTGGSGQRFENVPEIAKAQRAEVLFLDSLTAPVQIGDLVMLPAALAAGAADGPLRRIYQVRPYDYSLQVGLQRLPFAPLLTWTPTGNLSRVSGALLKVTDAAYAVATPMQGYLEPAPDMVKMAAFGQLDLRACYAYTLTPLALGTVLQDAGGDHWIAELPSDVWPLPGDCRTLVRHLIALPPGVS